MKEGRKGVDCCVSQSVTPILDLYAYLADFFSFWILHSSVWKAINIHAVVQGSQPLAHFGLKESLCTPTQDECTFESEKTQR